MASGLILGIRLATQGSDPTIFGGLRRSTLKAKCAASWWRECDLHAVQRVVPEGWIFRTYPPGKGPVFERM
jgi:hypothetical protein